MKNLTTNTKKAGAITMLLALSLSLGGCFQQVPSDKDSTNTPASSSASPTVSASPSIAAAPTADPTLAEKLKDNEITRGDDAKKAAAENEEYFDAAQKAAAASPLGVNVAETVKDKTTPEAKETFRDYDLVEGTRFSLAFFQSLVQKGDFYKPRDASKDFTLLADVTPMMTQRYEDEVKADIKRAGKFIDVITTNSEGTFGTGKDGVDLTPATIPTQKYWVNSVTADGEFLRIEAYAELTVLTKSGVVNVTPYNFAVSALPGADGSWQVDSIAWKAGQ